ncbi:MAG TPA: RHS repeat-associated core domain-containing protein [Symbiobacteriaceae bacterium]|nr:RHS repeat-associated core domain-containing protein [Symbiobacteriaceae bacterium]
MIMSRMRFMRLVAQVLLPVFVAGLVALPRQVAAAPASGGTSGQTVGADREPPARPNADQRRAEALSKLKPVSADEVVALRGATSRVFKTPKGYRMELSATPIHYATPDGVFEIIDNTIVAEPRGQFNWKNKAGAVTARFTSSPGSQRVQVEFDGRRVAMTLDESEGPLHGTVRQNQVEFAPPGAGYRYRYYVGASMVKEEIILDRFSGKTTWRFPLELEGLTPVSAEDGAVLLMRTDAVNEVGAVLQAPFAIDGAGVRTDDVALALVQTGEEQYAIDLQVDPMWLQDPTRAWPVTVDPDLYIQFNSTDSGMWAQIWQGQTSPSSAASDLYLKSGNTRYNLLQFDLTQLRGVAGSPTMGTPMQVTFSSLLMKVNSELSSPTPCTGVPASQCKMELIAEPLVRDWHMNMVTWDQPRWNTPGDPQDQTWTPGGEVCTAQTCPELPPEALLLKDDFPVYPKDYIDGGLQGANMIVNMTELTQRWLDGFPNKGVRLRIADVNGTGNALYFKVRSWDGASWSYGGPRMFVELTADTTKPTGAIVSPTLGTSVSGTVPVSVNVSDYLDNLDPGSLSRIDLLVDGNKASTVHAHEAGQYSGEVDLSGVPAGRHRLTARVYDLAGNWQDSSVDVYVTDGVLTSPANLRAGAVSATTTRLTWAPARASVLDGMTTPPITYVVERATNDRFTDAVTIGATAALTFDHTPPAGGPYYYRVAATTATVRSTPSNTAALGVPLAPAHLIAAALGGGQVQLQWPRSPSVADQFGLTYRVLRNGTPVQTVATNEWTDTVTAGQTYTYQVATVNAASLVSALTDPVSVTASGQTGPAAPAGVRAITERDNRIAVAWTPTGTPNAGYRVYRSTDQVNWLAVNTQPVTSWFYVDSGLTEGLTYYYQVETMVDAVTGPRSPAVGAVAAPIRRLGVDDRWTMLPVGAPGASGFVNLQNGNMVLQATDAVLPGPVLANVLRRTYNSQGTADGLLGGGWRLNTEWRLEDRGHSLIITEGDGTEHRFRNGGQTGYWVSDEPRYHWDVTYSGGFYILRQPDQTEYKFDAAGVLTQIRDRTGNTLTYEYNSRGQLYRVTNGAGRSFTFVYDAGDRLVQVNYPTNRFVQYGYDQAGRLAQVRDAVGDVTTYDYDATGLLLGVIDPAGRWVAVAYDRSDRITSWTDGMGNQTRVAYDGGHVSITDPHGGRTLFEVNQYGWLTRLTDAEQSKLAVPAPWIYAYSQTAGEWSITATSPLGLVTTARFDGRGNVVEVEEQGTDLTAPGVNSRITRHYYGGSEGTNNAGPNDLWKSVDPEGNETQVFYTASGPKRVERTVDALGNTTTYTYHPGNSGMIATISQANQHVQSFVYNAQWDVEAIYEDVYNPVTGSVTRLQRTFGYQDGMPVSESELHEPGASAVPLTRTFDPLDRVIRTAYPDGSQETVVLDPSGQVGVSVSRAGLRTAVAYDAAGRPTIVTGPDGGVVRSTYIGLQLTSIESQDGLVTRYSYDALYRPTATLNPDQTVQRVEYDAVGNATAMLKGPAALFDNPGASAYRVSATYYLANLVRSVKEPLPSYALLAATDATVHPDCVGTGTVCQMQAYTYDRNGKVRTMTDGNGYVTAYDYDKLGRLRFVTDALGTPTEYEYDDVGNQQKVFKAGYPRLWQASDGSWEDGQPDTYVYDSLGRLVKETTSILGINRATNYSYSPSGDLLSEQRPDGITVQYGYDAGHHNVQVHYANTTDQLSDVRFSVDAGGRRLMRSDEYGNTWYGYDAMGRPVSVRGLVDQVGYEYDAVGRRTALEFSLGRVTYTYQNGRLNTISDPVGYTTQFGYDANGHNTTISLPTANLTNTYYNLPSGETTDRLATRQWKSKDGTKTWWSGAYRYDHPGNVREATLTWHSSIATSANKLPGTQTITYTYDKLYRLANYHDTDTYKSLKTYSYEYDAAGNRLNAGNTTVDGKLRWKTPAGTVVSLEKRYDPYDSHILYASGAFAPLYEQVGPNGGQRNISYSATGTFQNEQYYFPENTEGGRDYATFYTYDAAERPNRVAIENAAGACYDQIREFTNDGDGRMIDAWSVYPGCGYRDRVVYEYDGQTVVSENSGHGSNHVWYITLPGSPAPLYSLRIRGRELKADTHITDHLGSTVEVVDYTAKISNWYTYDPFGVIEGSSSELINSYTFTSSVRDDVTGLYFMGARVYNAQMGRFLTQDTYKGNPWEPWTQNLYVYVGNNPVNWIDPTGHDVCAPGQSDCTAPVSGPGEDIPTWVTAIGEAATWLVEQAYAACKALSEPELTCGQAIEATGMITAMPANAATIDAAFSGLSMLTTTSEWSGTVSQASQAAFKAADTAGDFTVSSKHLASAGGRWAKFATDDAAEVSTWIKEALKSSNAQFLANNRPDSFKVIVDVGREIGTKGERAIQVIVGTDGKIWTAFPVK